MSSAIPIANDLLDRIGHLPPPDRLLLAEWIYAEAGPEAAVEAAWQAEAQRRLEEHLRTAGTTIPASQVFGRWGVDTPGRP